MVRSRFGKVLIAVRDAESRTRFLGYRPESYKLVVFVLSAVMAGIGGALYVPQVGIINPGEFAPGELDRGGDLGRGRRARHAVRRDPRRGARQFRQDALHRRAAGTLAVRARRLVHRRHAVPAQRHRRPVPRRRRAARTAPEQPPQLAPAKRRPGGDVVTAIGAIADTLLYLSGVTVSFDGFRALNNLSLVLEPGEMRAIIGPNGAGKTTMMDVITGKTRPERGQVVFDADTDLTKLDEPASPARHRPQVPEAHRVRARTPSGTICCWRSPATARPCFALFARQTRAERDRIERSWHHAARRAPRPARRPTSATARSSGSRSACCWRRSRSCCWSTSRWRA